MTDDASADRPAPSPSYDMTADDLRTALLWIAERDTMLLKGHRTQRRIVACFALLGIGLGCVAAFGGLTLARTALACVALAMVVLAWLIYPTRRGVEALVDNQLKVRDYSFTFGPSSAELTPDGLLTETPTITTIHRPGSFVEVELGPDHVLLRRPDEHVVFVPVRAFASRDNAARFADAARAALTPREPISPGAPPTSPHPPAPASPPTSPNTAPRA